MLVIRADLEQCNVSDMLERTTSLRSVEIVGIAFSKTNRKKDMLRICSDPEACIAYDIVEQLTF